MLEHIVAKRNMRQWQTQVLQELHEEQRTNNPKSAAATAVGTKHTTTTSRSSRNPPVRTGREADDDTLS